MPLARCGVGRGGGGWGLVTCGVIVVWVRVPEFEIYPIHIPGLLKNRPIHILDRPKCWPIHILPLIFYTHLLLVVDRYRSQFIEYQENKQPKKILWANKIYAYTGMSEKWGLSHTNQEKWGQSYTFCWKKGANHIPGSAEKEDHSARTSLLCHI